MKSLLALVFTVCLLGVTCDEEVAEAPSAHAKMRMYPGEHLGGGLGTLRFQLHLAE